MQILYHFVPGPGELAVFSKDGSRKAKFGDLSGLKADGLSPSKEYPSFFPCPVVCFESWQYLQRMEVGRESLGDSRVLPAGGLSP